MQSIVNFSKGFRFSLCVIDVYSKYAWVAHLEDEKGITITNAFQTLHESNRKPNKIWVDKGSESMKSCLQDNDIEIHPTHNEGKSAAEENILFRVVS